jgi:hypothetical protein
VGLGLEETQKGLANLVAGPNFARCRGLSHRILSLSSFILTCAARASRGSTGTLACAG